MGGRSIAGARGRASRSRRRGANVLLTLHPIRARARAQHTRSRDRYARTTRARRAAPTDTPYHRHRMAAGPPSVENFQRRFAQAPNLLKGH